MPDQAVGDGQSLEKRRLSRTIFTHQKRDLGVEIELRKIAQRGQLKGIVTWIVNARTIQVNRHNVRAGGQSRLHRFHGRCGLTLLRIRSHPRGSSQRISADQTSRINRAGSSMDSLIVLRNVTASRPSTMRWS